MSYYADDWLTILLGDCRTVMAAMDPESVQTVVTSPPYWGLRDYGTASWVGGDEACDHVEGMARGDTNRETPGGRGGSFRGGEVQFRDTCRKCGAIRQDQQLGLEPTPEAYVAAMVDVFREAVRERFAEYEGGSEFYVNRGQEWARSKRSDDARDAGTGAGIDTFSRQGRAGRNIRSVWTVATQPYPGAHFATFPPKLIEPCIKAGCPEGGWVLDPFAGSGTTGLVANRLGRRAVLIDLNADYLGQVMQRAVEGVPYPLGLETA